MIYMIYLLKKKIFRNASLRRPTLLSQLILPLILLVDVIMAEDVDVTLVAKDGDRDVDNSFPIISRELTSLDTLLRSLGTISLRRPPTAHHFFLLPLL